MPLTGQQEFFANRFIDMEPRIRHIEDFLAELTVRNGAQSAAYAIKNIATGAPASLPSSSGGSSGSSTAMAGDVVGTTDHSQVVQIEGVPIPAPVAGNDGQFVQYINATPAFQYVSVFGTALIVPQVTKTTSYLVTTSDTAIWADATGGAITITLPSAIANPGKVIIVKKKDASANAVTLATSLAQTIDGMAIVIIGIPNTSYTVISDGANYWIV